MASKSENNPSYETVTDFTIEWKISDIFPPSNADRDIASPVFEYHSVRRRIHLRKKGDYWEISIWRNMVDITSVLPIPYYTIGIKKLDGTVYKSISGKLYYRKSDEPYCIPKFLQSCDILRDKLQIANQGALMAFCTISRQDHRERFIRNAATQNENSNGTFKLAQDIKDLFLGEKNCDTTIKVADREFRAHRLILGARSKVFYSMYSHDTTERNTGIVETEDCDPEVFQEFLICLYSGTLQSLSLENAFSLYIVADKYDVQDVKQECLKFMKSNLSIANICESLTLALKYNEFELLKSATDFYVKNAKDISRTAKWLSFHKDHPTESNELYLKALEHYIID